MAFITSPTWHALEQPACLMPLHSSNVWLQWLQQVTDVVVRLLEGVAHMACTTHARLNLLNHAVAFLAATKSAQPQVLLVTLRHCNPAVIAYGSHTKAVLIVLLLSPSLYTMLFMFLMFLDTTCSACCCRSWI